MGRERITEKGVGGGVGWGGGQTCERRGEKKKKKEEWPAAVCLTSLPDQCQCRGGV